MIVTLKKNSNIEILSGKISKNVMFVRLLRHEFRRFYEDIN